MDVSTTLNFFGRTEEAIDFYRRAIDAEQLFLMRFRDSPNQSQVTEGMENKVFHATFRVGSTKFMASDVGCIESDVPNTFAGFALGLRVDSLEQAERFFTAIAEGGVIQIPLTETFFASRYGIVTDRFGVSWKVILEKPAGE